MSGHVKARLAQNCVSCSETWPCTTERRKRARLRARSAHIADQPIIEGSYVPPLFLLGGGWPEGHGGNE